MSRRSASPSPSPPAGSRAAAGANGRAGNGALAGRLRNPSLRVAAAAGVATHLPGLLYLLGLNAIAAGDPPLAGGLAQVLIFDAIWLAIPFAALVVSIKRPEAARGAIGRASTWMGSHQRPVLTFVFAAVGIYFVTRGVLDLSG